MNVVRRFGGVSAVLLATGRKGMTLVLSFLLFPKEFSWYYVVGALLVLGGLLFSGLHDLQQKKRKNKQLHKTGDVGTALMMLETKRLISGGGVTDQNDTYDMEHNGVLNGTSMSPLDTMSALEVTDRYDSSSPSTVARHALRSNKENGFFGHSPGHDHQQ